MATATATVGDILAGYDDWQYACIDGMRHEWDLREDGDLSYYVCTVCGEEIYIDEDDDE